MNGRKSWRGRNEEPISNSMVCIYLLSLSKLELTPCNYLDDAHAARRRYKKDIDHIKPDLVAYNKQKAIAMGQNPGSLVGFNPTAGSSELAVTSQEQRLAAENLYRDANTLIYGDSNPSEDAIDRVVSKINQEYVSNRYLLMFSTLTFRLALTRKVNSLGSASTRKREILHISTSTIASSTRRQVFSL